MRVIRIVIAAVRVAEVLHVLVVLGSLLGRVVPMRAIMQMAGWV